MRSVKFLIVAGAASLMSAAAFAADMPIAPPPMYAPPPPADFGGWYLRGDIGMSNQSAKDLTLASAPFPAGFQTTGFGFDSAPLFDLGIGYQFNNWFRADLTGQWRGRANLHASQFAPAGAIAPTFAAADNYSGSKSEAVVMLNGYVDLGTWWCVTPYIGAGVGASYNRISGFRDDGVIYNAGVLSNSVTYGADAGKWNFAWALHAGLGYRVLPNVTLELGYSYMNLGDAVTGPTNSFDGVTVVNGSGFAVKDITSHDLKLGVRWDLDTPPPPPPPLIRKG
ncbi:MAG: outer membrane protein [Gemmatimonas sp.]